MKCALCGKSRFLENGLCDVCNYARRDCVYYWIDNEWHKAIPGRLPPYDLESLRVRICASGYIAVLGSTSVGPPALRPRIQLTEELP